MRMGEENTEKVNNQERLIEQMMTLLTLNNIDYAHLMSDNDNESAAKRQKLDEYMNENGF